ncbi:MAG: MBL fold metallo-hydrolase [Bacteriovoracaceae bacterium]|nr:MBL fold metallo-hydrolase [Bacteriovoracaceae bacterium]
MRILLLIFMLAACNAQPKFKNLVDTPLTTGGAGFWRASWAFFFENDPRTKPDKELPVKAFSFSQTHEDYAAIWLGHASVLIKMNKLWIMTDPMLKERLSHWTGVWPKRFHPLPFSESEMPQIEAVLISHDHQDHLDEYTIRDIHKKVNHFIVPREVGQYLIGWGVDPKKIHELDWWESIVINEVSYTCTPARHGSGRMPFDWDHTLWSGWSIKDQKKNIFFAGDTGFFPQFKDIGSRLGPFDLTLFPIGAYDVYWSAIHLNPEEAIEAHKLVGGKKMLPIHWATFDLSRHAWDEPGLRFQKAATGIKYSLPIPGEIVLLD